MFNNEELEKLKAENANYKSQLQFKEMQVQQLEQQVEHKNNELFDLVSQAFLGFRRIVEITTRNDYGQPEQKIRQISEEAKTQENYFAQLELNVPCIKNRTTTTNHSNK